MNQELEKYLGIVDRHLRPLPLSERVDIVKEIKSSILEMEQESLTTQQILARLGEPKELAKAYLGDLLAGSSGFSLNRVLAVFAFYSVVGFSGIIVIPTLAIAAPVFLLTGILAPVFGALKFVDFLFQLGIPYLDRIQIVLGGLIALNPLGGLPVPWFWGRFCSLQGAAAGNCWSFTAKRLGKPNKNYLSSYRQGDSYGFPYPQNILYRENSPLFIQRAVFFISLQCFRFFLSGDLFSSFGTGRIPYPLHPGPC